MRKPASFLIPLTVITVYYALCFALAITLLNYFPSLAEYFPVGGISEIASRNLDTFEPVYTMPEDSVLSSHGLYRLLFSEIGAAVAIVPVSWVYFITSTDKDLDASFTQTIVLMPIVVTGIAMIVMNSLALAFSLAGVVAAVRFRFSLQNPAYAMYIFVAIAIGLGCGIGALGVATVISMTFVYTNLVIWKLQYGKDMSGPFLSTLTRRERREEDY